MLFEGGGGGGRLRAGTAAGHIVLCYCFRKLVAAGTIRLGDKIEVICSGGHECGFECRDAWIRDGAGGSPVAIGVVRVLLLRSER